MSKAVRWCMHVGVTFLLTMAVAVPFVHVFAPRLIVWVDRRDWSMNGLLPFGVQTMVEPAFVVAVLSCVPMLICIGCYHHLRFRRFRDGTTYCGSCLAELKNLVEPRCPQCGQVI